ncbi:serine--tRNA ligase [Candidatus Roizmanbacteria bacterium]|nr:serine--tRNA ligase [Candidatus Roizmanbacteria bacterium]
MIDLNLLRKNPQQFRDGATHKNTNPDVVDEVLRFDKERRELIQKAEELRKERNEITQKIKASQDKKNNAELIERVRSIKKKLDDVEPRLKMVENNLDDLVARIPNPPLPDVRVGKNDTENEILRTWGEQRKFDFKPKDHLELGELHDIIDVRRAARVSGARFYYLKGDGALLEWALLQFAIETLMKEGFTPTIPPVLIKKSSMKAMGYLEHGGEEDMFVLEKDGLVLVGTSEQSIGPMHMGEVFDKKELPRRYFGYSACFRREAGSYGKDTRGIIRVHQFNKVEMFSFTTPEEGDKEHEYFLSLEEKFLQALEIPYQVVKMCSGDLGAPAARKYDLEAWIPTQEKYRELTSTSTTTDFQSRRLHIKYRDGNNTEYVHMLNGTAFSMGRPIVAILENFQEKDGSIRIPAILQKWMGKEKISV